MARPDDLMVCVSESGDKILIDKRSMQLSQLIDEILNEDENDVPEIPFKMSTELLQRVVEYCKYYQSSPVKFDSGNPVESNELSRGVPEWYADFVDLPVEEIFDLMKAANYLGIESLIELTCMKIACMLKGKDPEEIRSLFGVQDDFSPEEKENFLNTDSWIKSGPLNSI